MNQITIFYPIKYETSEILSIAKSIGTVIKRETLREVYSVLDRDTIVFLENKLNAVNSPYDLIEYADDINTPKIKRVRPHFSKEISCVLCSDEGEDGLIQVSRLLHLLEQSKDADLKEHLMKEIQSASFKFDNIPALV